MVCGVYAAYRHHSLSVSLHYVVLGMGTNYLKPAAYGPGYSLLHGDWADKDW